MNNLYTKKNRVLLAELVRTDFKLRYQGSALGYIWSLLRPLFLFLTLYLVFIKFLKIGAEIPHAPIYLLLGIVLWNFFNEMTFQSLGSIVGRGDLIRKIRIPRWIIIISTSLAALINLGFNLLVVAVFMYFNHVRLGVSAAWLPLIIAEIYVLALGVSLFLSAAFVKYRDVTYIWEVVMQAAFYATPILYPISRIKNATLLKLLFTNPMAQALQDARYAVVTPSAVTTTAVFGTVTGHLITLALTLVILAAGVGYFRHESKYFAENL